MKNGDRKSQHEPQVSGADEALRSSSTGSERTEAYTRVHVNGGERKAAIMFALRERTGLQAAISSSTSLTSERQAAIEHKTRRAFARFAWCTLVYNVLVVLWGAFVRASYSGDGCGSHWPLCNGEVIPTEPVVKTVIEFSHRVTSGIALLLVILLVWLARRLFPSAHEARRAVRWAFFFTITEALIGAGLVVFGLVADDDSVARALSLAVHLINTFILLAALTLTAWFAGDAATNSAMRRRQFTRLRAAGGAKWVFISALVGMLLLGTSGAVAALGDTLFPAASLAQAWRQDSEVAAHILVRLRVLHPVIACLVAINLVSAAWIGLRTSGNDARTRRLAWAVVALVFGQMLAGGINVLLLAPVWMQIVHLLLADGLWIAFVLLTVTVFSFEEARDDVRDEQQKKVAALDFART